MADTELGDLRRPPRPLEQRLERVMRWRAQGLDDGHSDSTFPMAATDATAIAAGGSSTVTVGGGGVVPFAADSFDLTATSPNVFLLSRGCHQHSEVVWVDGVVLAPDEYSIDVNRLTFTDLDALREGIGDRTWGISLRYACYDLATPAPSVPALGFLVTTDTTFPEELIELDVGILIAREDAGTPVGVFATWTQLRTGAEGLPIWVGTGIGSGSAVGFSGGAEAGNTGVIAVFHDVSGTVAIDDLHATITLSGYTGDVSAAPATTTEGQIVVSAATTVDAGGNNWTLSGDWTSSGVTAPLATFTGNAFFNIGLMAGTATGTSADATFAAVAAVEGAGTGEAVNVAFSIT